MFHADRQRDRHDEANSPFSQFHESDLKRIWIISVKVKTKTSSYTARDQALRAPKGSAFQDF